MSEGLIHKLADEIRREGPIPFDAFMEAALYDPEFGFFITGGGAGRSEGDFITSPEVGSLFGALVARALDAWWDELGRPDPYVVVDAGAGRGQLARDVMRVGPACSPALRYVMVERSASLRRTQHDHLQIEPPEDALGPAVKLGQDDDPEPVPGTGPIVTQTETLPAVPFTGAVVANELLDNLPFRVVERLPGGWHEVRVALGDHDDFVEVLVPAEPELSTDADELYSSARPGARLPVQNGMLRWFAECGAVLRRGFVAVLDHADAAAGLAERGPDSWLRTYRGHGRGAPPLEAPGAQDITADVVLETVRVAAGREGFGVVEELAQAEWLRRLGVEELVEEGRRAWEDGAAAGALRAVKGRSRVHEAEVLLHPAGLGAHRVVVLSKGL